MLLIQSSFDFPARISGSKLQFFCCGPPCLKMWAQTRLWCHIWQRCQRLTKLYALCCEILLSMSSFLFPWQYYFCEKFGWKLKEQAENRLILNECAMQGRIAPKVWKMAPDTFKKKSDSLYKPIYIFTDLCCIEYKVFTLFSNSHGNLFNQSVV